MREVLFACLPVNSWTFSQAQTEPKDAPCDDLEYEWFIGCEYFTTESCEPCEICSTLPNGAIPDYGASSTLHDEIYIHIGRLTGAGDDIESGFQCNWDGYVYGFNTSGELDTSIETGQWGCEEAEYTNELGWLTSDRCKYDYWYIPPSGDYMEILDRPFTKRIFDSNQNLLHQYDVDNLTLCDVQTKFKRYGELWNYWEDWHMGSGGVFKLSFPQFPIADPVYFVSAPTRYMYYTDGPDAWLYYGVKEWEERCAPSGTVGLKAEAFTTVNNFVDHMPNSHTVWPAYNDWSTAQEVLFTTDLATIEGFWGDNAITVGFVDSTTTKNLDFFASNSPGSPTIPSGAFVIQELDLTSANEYRWRSGLQFPNNMPRCEYNGEQRFYLEVIGKFENGEEINNVVDVTEVVSYGNADRRQIYANIRGKIKDYASQVLNYRVRLYTCGEGWVVDTVPCCEQTAARIGMKMVILVAQTFKK